jgi:hypothetical protein
MKIKKILLVIAIIIIATASIFLIDNFVRSKKEVVSSKKPIEIVNIKAGQIIKSPLVIDGVVNGGNWTGFEGQVGRVELVQPDGKELGLAPLMAKTDFMNYPINFEATLNFDSSEEENASLVFYNENPSGLTERDESIIIPVKSPIEKVKVLLYFGKEGNDDSCVRLFPIEREIIKTEGIARATIEALLTGLTVEEKNKGYFTSINEGVKVNKLTIINGTAKIDFDKTMEEGVSGSCRVSAIKQQIVQTLMQFSSINTVIISINGRTEDILQP